jgi:hypothetical protein
LVNPSRSPESLMMTVSGMSTFYISSITFLHVLMLIDGLAYTGFSPVK